MPAPDWVRRLEWRIKNNFTFSLPVFKTPVSPEQIIIDLSSDQKQRFDTLNEKYDLSSWKDVCSRIEWLDNLYLLDVCDHYLDNLQSEISLDIGSKNWGYLPALTSFTNTPWHGVELDAFRRYWNLSSRKDHAEYMMKICSQCKYFPDSLTNIHGEYSFITWFLPFVKPEPLRYWGLPDSFFEPEKLLTHAWQLLMSGGIILIINQGEEEAGTQKTLFKNAGIEACYLGEITSIFSTYKQPRFGWLVTKSL